MSPERRWARPCREQGSGKEAMGVLSMGVILSTLPWGRVSLVAVWIRASKGQG